MVVFMSDDPRMNQLMSGSLFSDPELLKEVFLYHPPTTAKRIEAHKCINEAAYEYMSRLVSVVKDKSLLLSCYYAVQQARMLANQAVTFEELLELKQLSEKIEDAQTGATLFNMLDKVE